jgi:L-cysteine S-thiosulfotransferase
VKRFTHCIGAGLLALLAGCETSPQSGKGFTLPEGDVVRGEAAFVALQCHACHSVSGVELPEREPELDRPVALGGEVTRISTYGELVASIINPSHKLARGYPQETIAENGESKMTNYNEVMTVQQLTDLVAFLQSHYTLAPQVPTDYPLLY